MRLVELMVVWREGCEVWIAGYSVVGSDWYVHAFSGSTLVVGGR